MPHFVRFTRGGADIFVNADAVAHFRKTYTAEADGKTVLFLGDGKIQFIDEDVQDVKIVLENIVK